MFVTTGAINALSPEGSHDFQWTPTRDLISGVNPYAEFLQWKADGNELTPPHFLNHSPSYPASVYVLFAPIASLDWPTAKLVWLIINLFLISAMLSGLQRLFPINRPALLFGLVIVFLCATPLRASLGAGQHNFLSLAAFIWAYHYAKNHNNVKISGLLLAIAWVKYSLTFPLTLLFICRGKWKPIILASLIHAALTIVAALKLNMWPHEFFLSSVEVVMMGDGTGFLNLVAITMKLNLPLLVAVTLILASTGYLFWWLPGAKCEDDLLLMTFLGLFACAVFYHHGYDFIVLLFCAWSIARGSVQGIHAMSCATLLIIAWAGQWLVYELAPHLGTAGLIATQITDNLLVVVFYCTLALIWRRLHSTHAEKLASGTTSLSF